MLGKGILAVFAALGSGAFAAHELINDASAAAIWAEPLVNVFTAVCICAICYKVLRGPRKATSRA